MVEHSGVFADSDLDTAEDLARWYRQFAPSGVVTAGPDTGQGMEVTATGTGLLTIGTGYAIVGGYWYRVSVPIQRGVQANTSGQPRQDLVVVRADPQADEATVTILPGTAGASGPPSPTRNPLGVWDMVLAVITIAGGSTVVAPGDVDLRPRETTAPTGAIPCHSSHRPPEPFEGMLISETDTGRVLVRVGGGWRTVADTEYPTSWQPITMRNGYGTPGHGRSPSWRFLFPGRVELRGTISRNNGGALPNNDYYARLPAAARPNAWVRGVGASESRNNGGNWGATSRLEVASENASNKLPGQLIAFHEHAPRWVALDNFAYDI